MVILEIVKKVAAIRWKKPDGRYGRPRHRTFSSPHVSASVKD
jgi:hypothetical protein